MVILFTSNNTFNKKIKTQVAFLFYADFKNSFVNNKVPAQHIQAPNMPTNIDEIPTPIVDITAPLTKQAVVFKITLFV